MDFKRALLPFQLTPVTMAILQQFYKPGNLTEREPQTVALHNKRIAWKLQALQEKEQAK